MGREIEWLEGWGAGRAIQPSWSMAGCNTRGSAPRPFGVVCSLGLWDGQMERETQQINRASEEWGDGGSSDVVMDGCGGAAGCGGATSCVRPPTNYRRTDIKKQQKGIE